MQDQKTMAEENVDTGDIFMFTSSYLKDELDLIQTQQENIVSVAEQLELAFKHSQNMTRLVKILKKTDEVILQGMGEKRRKESSTLNLMEEIKSLVARQKYEDIDKLMATIHKGSQEKIHLSQEQLNTLRTLGGQLKDIYSEAMGFARLTQGIYERVAKTYEDCQAELNKEMQEEEALSKAGSYGGAGPNRIASPQYRDVFGRGPSNWFTRY